MNFIRHTLRDFWRRIDCLKEKSTAEVKISQRYLFHYYQSLALGKKPPRLEDTGFRVYSQFEEDGILLFLFAVLGTRNKIFVDIGAGNGVANSNCANLAINSGWHGLFIEKDVECVEQGIRFYKNHPDTSLYPPQFVCSQVTKENINSLIQKAGLEGEIDLLSIDIDGNDYWIWEALECIQPRVVLIETHVEFGEKSIVVPYDPNYAYPGIHKDYHGASPVAMAKLAKRKGYRLVGANHYGFNTVYIQKGLGEDLIPEAPVDSILRHPRMKERLKIFEEIKDMPYLEV